MLLITAFIHTSQLAFPPTGNRECHAFWAVKVAQYRVHLHSGATATRLAVRWAAGGSAEVHIPPEARSEIPSVPF